MLPFENASQRPGHRVPRRRAHRGLIEQLSRLRSLKVMARATVFRFKGATDPQEAGRTARRGSGAHRQRLAPGRPDCRSPRSCGDGDGRPPLGRALRPAVRGADPAAGPAGAGIAKGLRLALSGDEKAQPQPVRHRERRGVRPVLRGSPALLARETEEDDLEAQTALPAGDREGPEVRRSPPGIGEHLRQAASTAGCGPAEAWPQSRRRRCARPTRSTRTTSWCVARSRTSTSWSIGTGQPPSASIGT